MKKFPKINRNIILSIFLLLGVTFSVVTIVMATTPDPGHNFTEVGGGAVQGDLLYGSAPDVLSALGKNITASRYLSNSGASNNPAWAQVDLTNGVTGALPDGNISSAATWSGKQAGSSNLTSLSGLSYVSNAFVKMTGANTFSLDTNSYLANPMTTLGDIIYGGASGVATRLGGSAGFLKSTGAAAPAWSAVSLTADVSGILPTANGGTGIGFFTAAGPTTARIFTFPDAAATVLTDNVDVTVAQGGTGLSTLTTGNVILGAGASTPTFVAPGTSGNVLTSNASTWTSAAPAVRTVYNQSVSTPAAGFAADTYLAGSSTAIPATGLRVGTRYHLIFNVSKTAAGVATPILNIRFGTAGAVGDTSRCAMTWTAGTAAIDDGIFQVWATFRTIGSGTSAVIQCVGEVTHRLTTTGLINAGATARITTTGGGFDSTVANSIIGVSVNGGTSAAWTITLVQAELTNLP